jgi:lipoic acid synthetase
VVDHDEPRRVSEAVARSGLRYVVLTQVCRDDLADGGAALMAETVRRIHEENPAIRVELLIGDLGGPAEPLRTVLAARPDVLAHNIETVRSLSSAVRDHRAGYDRSLSVLRAAQQWAERGAVTKSSLMLGLGETDAEIREALRDLREASVDLVTFGQYLRPTPAHRPVSRFVPPEEFARWKEHALSLGFHGAEAGPLVRSSYHAEELYWAARAGSGG